MAIELNTTPPLAGGSSALARSATILQFPTPFPRDAALDRLIAGVENMKPVARRSG